MILLLFIAYLSPVRCGEPGPDLRSARRFTHRDKSGTRTERAPVALNDDHDNGQFYKARRFWRCAAMCPDGGCDHRTLEPVWDYLWVGGEVENEDDLLAVELVADELPPGTPLRFEVVSKEENIRVWPSAGKGHKRDIVPASGFALRAGDLPMTLYIEGIAPGSAELRLSAEDGRAAALFIDVLRLVETQSNRRKFIYEPGKIVFRVEPADVVGSMAYLLLFAALRNLHHQARLRFRPEAGGSAGRGAPRAAPFHPSHGDA